MKVVTASNERNDLICWCKSGSYYHYPEPFLTRMISTCQKFIDFYQFAPFIIDIITEEPGRRHLLKLKTLRQFSLLRQLLIVKVKI